MTDRYSPLARSVWLTLALTATACGPDEPSTGAPRSTSIEVSPKTQRSSRESSTALPSPAGPQTVTLITGDSVTLRNGAPIVTPGPGRTKIAFSVHSGGGRVMVVPSDMSPLIAADQVDPALFDVTLLLESGYGDDRRTDLPLLATRVSSAPGIAPRLVTGVTVDRELPALHAVALRQPKANGGAALTGMRTSARLASGPPTKIWLDRIYKLSLDHSVPQIGGPAAHARGFTGTGVTVAVLDSGIDSTHPDLAGKVTAAEDFTGDGAGVLDVVGHGTHVASIIAGTGAASNGQFAGVAPDAQLVSGRVCEAFGCAESAILAGMQWAVIDQHAKIVNLSLGSSDTPGIDPLEEAVDQLSAQFGALFVVAAGNDGLASSIGSPGSADAALTVGSVDRDDQLAVSSSRGPRLGDRAVKPEVTAPGVGIVAARAANVPPIGTPVGASYQRLSGTSMATPHVAGAAALLLDANPAYSPARVRDYLVARATTGRVGDPHGSPNRLLYIPAPPKAPVIATTRVTAGLLEPYSGRLTLAAARRGSWSVARGSLPAGLRLTADGIISGTPTEPGTSTATVRFVDFVPNTVTKTVTFTVSPTAPVIATDSLPAASAGVAYAEQLGVSDGRDGTWSVVDGSLPDGLALSPEGLLDGTPTAAGTATFTVGFTDRWGGTATATYTLTTD